MGLPSPSGVGDKNESYGISKVSVRIILLYSNAEGYKHLGRVVLMRYMIADCNKKRRYSLQMRMDIYKSVMCVGHFGKEVDLLENAWIERPEVVLVYAGDHELNAYSVLKRIKLVTPEVNVVFYSEQKDYAVDAYDHGADYFLPLPVDDIKIGKLVFRYFDN